MAIQYVQFPSYNERDLIKGVVYTPIQKAVGIVQISHGLNEHFGRYLYMISRLLEEGFVVCGQDHVGHGQTALASESWGDFGEKGYKTTTEDEHSLAKIVREQFPDLPYFFYGHSWGAMIAREYAFHYHKGISGMILSGTPVEINDPTDFLSKTGKLIDEGKGSQRSEEIMLELTALLFDMNHFSRFDEGASHLAVDPAVQQDYDRDLYNNKELLTIQSARDVLALSHHVSQQRKIEEIPSTFPFYQFCGDQDPACNGGQGAYQLANWLSNSGHKITTRMYSGYRHEVHNEPAIKEEVITEMLIFLKENCS